MGKITTYTIQHFGYRVPFTLSVHRYQANISCVCLWFSSLMSHQWLPYPEVSLPSLHTNVGVIEHQYHQIVYCAINFCFAWTTGSNHGTSYMTMCETPQGSQHVMEGNLAQGLRCMVG